MTWSTLKKRLAIKTKTSYIAGDSDHDNDKADEVDDVPLSCVRKYVARAFAQRVNSRCKI